MNLELLLRAHPQMGNCPSWPSRVRIVILCGIVCLWITSDDGTWGADIFNGHAIGCNAVSWAPATLPGSLITPSQQSNSLPNTDHLTSYATVKRFASAGCDNLVKIWGYRFVFFINLHFCSVPNFVIIKQWRTTSMGWRRNSRGSCRLGPWCRLGSQYRASTFVYRHSLSSEYSAFQRTKIHYCLCFRTGPLLFGLKIHRLRHGWRHSLILPPFPVHLITNSLTLSGEFPGVWLAIF